MKRSVSTEFWSDPYIEALSTDEKLLFLYLLTNGNTNMLGVYETTLRRISFETGLTEKAVSKALTRFANDDKVYFKLDRYVFIANFLKHQSMNTNMQKSAIDTYNKLPSELRVSELPYPLQRDSKAFESLCKAFEILPKIEVEVEVEREVEGEGEVEREKKKTPIPPLSEFLEHAKEKAKENGLQLEEYKVRLKYEAWVEAGWVTGKGTAIKNWKSTLNNTIQYLLADKLTGTEAEQQRMTDFYYDEK